jgi:cysteinyl-tRNA synthetase
MLEIYNSLTRRKEPFTPLEAGKVRMYVCGMTVYDYCHMGHARVLVVFDMITRYLRSMGYEVTYVRNITDIDDKIIKRANENDEPFTDLTQRFIDAMHEDAGKLGVLEPDEEPRATAYMDDIRKMIQQLLDNGHAYQAENGDVYYDVRSFAGYGALSGRDLEDERAGARVAVDEDKRDPLDFVLWKAAKPGEPSWPSAWGDGRPGWHIECSAMSTCCLGSHFDIHGGGMDLKFPHHENEIAQSEGATGEKFVNVWMHNGFVEINEEKMSKSLGNFFTVREVLQSYRSEELRYFILASHYRSPLNYSNDNLEQARAGLKRLYTALRGMPQDEDISADVEDNYAQRFHAAMQDDFNTAGALSVLFDLARDINRAREAGDNSATKLAGRLRQLGGVLGLLQRDPEAVFQDVSDATTSREDAGILSREQVEQLIGQRSEARKNRDFAESDRIRDELKAHGIVLEDGPQGTTWRRE